MQLHEPDGSMTLEHASILVVHSASGHSGKTTICKALVHDLPFDIYIKLSRRSPHLAARSLSAGTLSEADGDTGRLSQSQRAAHLGPLSDILFLDGPRSETDEAIASAVQQWPPDTRILIEGYCTPLPQRSQTMYVLSCPLAPDPKPDMGTSAAQANLIVVNRFPGCSPVAEAALVALLRDWNPQAALVAGSIENRVFLETVEEAVLRLLPALGSA